MALNTRTGKVQWLQSLRSVHDFYSRGAIAANGTTVLSFAESSTTENRFDTYRLQTFNAQSGNRLWTTVLHAPRENETSGFGYLFAANPTIELHQQALYVQVGGELQSSNPTTGQQRWVINRPWFNTSPQSVWYGLDIAASERQLAILRFNSRQRLLQILNPTTGKSLKQTTIPLDKLTTTSDRITANNRSVFVETSGLIPLGNNTFRSSKRTTVTSYDIDSGQIRFRTLIAGDISNLQAVGDTLQLSTYDQLLALNSQTGRVLWQRALSQIKCFNTGYSWRVDAKSVYINCDHRRAGQDSSTLISLSPQTGQIQWQLLVSPNRYSEYFPSAITAHQLLTFRQVRQGNQQQTQAIALDRQTGRLLWTVALFDDRYVNTFRSIVATDRDRFFILDALPYWQIWLLHWNRHWYLKQPIAN